MIEQEALLLLHHLTLAHKIKGKELLDASDSALCALSLLPESLQTPSLFWREDLQLIAREGIALLDCYNPLFPTALAKSSTSPLLLYVKGEITDADRESLSIVGTRKASLYGKEMAEKLAEEASFYGMTIVSGMARGIDTAAHRGALKSGRTIAVLGSGICSIYPPENSALAEGIVKRGALVSEYPMQTAPAPYRFPQRNRIIAAMGKGCLLVEAPMKSGAMITMEMARQMGKKCFALPGRVDSETFRGNHSLMKKGEALLVENGQEMVSQLTSKFLLKKKSQEPTLFDLEKKEEDLLQLLPAEELSFEELIIRTQLSAAALSARLLSLCLKGKVREFPGKLFKKVERS